MTGGQRAAWVRDVPVSCVCEWVWRGDKWVRGTPHLGCPWHTAEAGR